MALSVTIPISTEVIENNPDCKIDGQYEKGRIVIRIDTRYQKHYQRLGVSTQTKLHWGDAYTYEVQELSGFSWPIRYVVQARSGDYLDGQGQRVHFTTQATGIDSRRKVSAVLMRAAVLLVVMAGAGYHKSSWLLAQLFQVVVSKSALQRSTKWRRSCRMAMRSSVVSTPSRRFTKRTSTNGFPKGSMPASWWCAMSMDGLSRRRRWIRKMRKRSSRFCSACRSWD